MKISYIIMQWPALSETFAVRDILALKKLGHEVDVFALRPDFRNTTKLKKEMGSTKIPSTKIGAIPYLIGLFLLLFYFKNAYLLSSIIFKNELNKNSILKSFILMPSVFYIWRKIIKNKPDIVHLFWGHFPSMVGWLLQNGKIKIPHTIFLGPYDLQYNYALSAIVAKKASHVFTNTFENIDKLFSLKLQKNNISVMYGGINTDIQIQGKKKQNSFIFVGRLIRAKGIYDMLDVFEHIVKKHPNSMLTVIGDGDDRKNFSQEILNKKLSNNVKLTGWLNSDDVYKHLISAQTMLFLSHSERLPNAIKEAMLCKVIAFSSNTVGIGEMIEHGVDGMIVTSKNPNDIANNILNLLKDTNKCEILTKKAREKILTNFNVNIEMKKYLKVWKNKIK